ncbi:MAG: PAS domain-containing protein [Alphaproteobacteria bacterium]|nr:PAS domain-containing protein [Alphaproteobacteria bacterium]
MNAHISIMSRAGWSQVDSERDVSEADQVLGNPILSGALRLWFGLCRKGQLPLREDLDTLILRPDIFPRIVLLEGVERGGRRDLRYRLFGTGLANNLGADLTGHYVRDVFDDATYAEEMISICWRAIDRKQPIAASGQYLPADPASAPTATCRLFLPLRPLPSGTPLLLLCPVYISSGEIVERAIRDLSAYVPGDTIAFTDRMAGRGQAK